MNDIIWAGIVSLIFLSLFVISECIYKKNNKCENTRKLVHFGGAFVTIFFPFILKSHWSVLALAVAFGLIMYLTKKFGLLESVHNVERKSDGAIFHPIAIYTCFLYSQIINEPWFYVISILILAISDALAALVGKNYGAYEYTVEVGIRKTFEGSITFFLTSFMIVHLILLLATSTGRVESVLIALLISLIVTLFEANSLRGADNLFIPLGTMFILSKTMNLSISGISYQLMILLAFIIGYIILMLPYKRIGFSGVVVLGLINYIIWALLGNFYAAILLGLSFICAKTNLILDYECDVAEVYMVRPVLYILTVPITCAFLSGFLGTHVIFPFITSIICEIIRIKTKLFNNDLNKGLLFTSLISLISLGVSYALIR